MSEQTTKPSNEKNLAHERMAELQNADSSKGAIASFEKLYQDALEKGHDKMAARSAVELAKIYMANELVSAAKWSKTALKLLKDRPQDPVYAQAQLLNQMSLEDEQAVDPQEMLEAAQILTAYGLWNDAYLAHITLARLCRLSNNISGARFHSALAIGAVEASGNSLTTSSALHHLARAEMSCGDPERALVCIDQAIFRCKRVRGVQARLIEAKCLETAGEAWLALGHPDNAIAHFRGAAVRYDTAAQPNAVERVKQSIIELNGQAD